ncbi:outer membrane beta-barrel protein [Sphingomonas sp. JC676]|uniref:outer membrane beta-barrel protein n=1 Tax=Sphingomonas sp. JC676 TaxID=2768065 RepID=UPI0016580B97|nr:outer membrane beta-barrel protein [Sphingomonas sp. JC676]MBC9030856.1 outer membrane beta-barrel protein [Sphingomonas sp. JC676]
MTLAPKISILAALLLAGTGTAWAQAETAPAPVPAPTPTPAPQSVPVPDATAASEPAQEEVPADTPPPPTTDIISGRTLSILLDGRLVAADGHKRFSDGGTSITRFSGAKNGDFRVEPLPIEADLIWTPHFTSSLSGNVSVAWQRDQENAVDVIESFVTFLPPRSGKVSISAKAGLYWPEISLEHATGGAWSTVHTITPSAINSWVGEETKVVGAEATLTASLGNHDISATAGVFGFNDTSGTLLSFRGWALHDMKATMFGRFKLPPRNQFMTGAQEDVTRSTIELDNRPGFYGRIEWRPPAPFTINAFYYDNRGNPEAFTPNLQWGWRTRFANLGLTFEPVQGTRILAQGMYGTTQMGFKDNGVYWVDTMYRSAYLLVAHEIGKGEISGRAEFFNTRERGSEMDHDQEKQDGWALTAAGRWSFTNNLTGFLEVLRVNSQRGTRARLGLPDDETQTVIQASARLRI